MNKDSVHYTTPPNPSVLQHVRERYIGKWTRHPERVVRVGVRVGLGVVLEESVFAFSMLVCGFEYLMSRWAGLEMIN